MSVPDAAYSCIGVTSVQGEPCWVLVKVDEAGYLVSETVLLPDVKSTARDEYVKELLTIMKELLK